MRVLIYASRESYKAWLDERVFRSIGLRRSYREVARLSGLSAGTVKAILDATRLPTRYVVAALAPVLRVEPEELERRAGLSPLVEIDTVHPTSLHLSENERNTFISALERALSILGSP